MKTIAISLILCLVIFSCEEKEEKRLNPPASGFNVEASDEKAIEIADSVMEASGGRDTWDNTEYLQWRFFGNRLHTWNKKTGDLIIESEKDSLYINMNLESMKGKVVIKGEEITDEVAKNGYLKRGKEYWINDSYWIFVPYKLKDSGVTLKYLGSGKNKAGVDSEKLGLTFNEVGVTPENKYVIYVDPTTNLVNQWDFYTNYEDEEPRFSSSWTDYQDYNGLKLSASRGDGRGMQDIEVGQQLAAKFK